MPVLSLECIAKRRKARQAISRSMIFAMLASVALESGSRAAATEAKIDGVAWTTSSCVKPDQQTVQAALPAALLGLLLPKLIESGLTFVGNAIAKAGAPVDHHASANASTSMYTVIAGAPTPVGAAHPDLLVYDENPTVLLRDHCIVAVFGLARQGSTPGEIGVSAPIPLQPAGQALDPALWSEVNRHFDGGRVAILVAEIATSPDQTAFQFVPRYIQFSGALMNKRMDGQRSAVFTVSILTPGGTADGAATAVRTFSFADLSSPLTLSGAKADALRSSWIPLPAAPDPVKARLAATSSRRSDYNTMTDVLASKATADEKEKAQFKQARLKQVIDDDDRYLAEVAPVTFRVDLVETEPGSKFLVALGQALAANAKDLSGPIADQLDPQKRATAAATEADNQDTLRIAAINAATDLQKAKDAKDPAGLRIAQIKAAAACRKLEAAGYADPACVLAP